MPGDILHLHQASTSVARAARARCRRREHASCRGRRGGYAWAAPAQPLRAATRSRRGAARALASARRAPPRGRLGRRRGVVPAARACEVGRPGGGGTALCASPSPNIVHAMGGCHGSNRDGWNQEAVHTQALGAGWSAGRSRRSGGGGGLPSRGGEQEVPKPATSRGVDQNTDSWRQRGALARAAPSGAGTGSSDSVHSQLRGWGRSGQRGKGHGGQRDVWRSNEEKALGRWTLWLGTRAFEGGRPHAPQLRRAPARGQRCLQTSWLSRDGAAPPARRARQDSTPHAPARGASMRRSSRARKLWGRWAGGAGGGVRGQQGRSGGSPCARGSAKPRTTQTHDGDNRRPPPAPQRSAP